MSIHFISIFTIQNLDSPLNLQVDIVTCSNIIDETSTKIILSHTTLIYE